MKVTVKVLNKGDTVISVTEKMIAVKRKNGEVDIMPLVFENGFPEIDTENIMTISYGTNAVETIVDGECGDVTITTF